MIPPPPGWCSHLAQEKTKAWRLSQGYLLLSDRRTRRGWGRGVGNMGGGMMAGTRGLFPEEALLCDSPCPLPPVPVVHLTARSRTTSPHHTPSPLHRLCPRRERPPPTPSSTLLPRSPDRRGSRPSSAHNLQGLPSTPPPSDVPSKPCRLPFRAIYDRTPARFPA